MSTTDLLALFPLLVVAATTVAVLVAITIRRHHGTALGLTLSGLAAAFASLPVAALASPHYLAPLLIVDGYSLFYMGLIFAATFLVAVLCHGYIDKQAVRREELYLLLLVAALGSAVLVASSHFASFFLGLELLSIALYVLVAYLYRRRISLEAGIKYLVLAAASSAFLLFGMALVYAETGTMEFGRIASWTGAGSLSTLLLAGTALMVTGIGFKLAVVPFHMWTADVYEGAPAPVTAFVATVSKGGIFGLLLRYFHDRGAQDLGPVFLVFSVIAVASMFAGNLLALLQNNVKRILAYSSIAHLGYLLVAFEVGGRAGAGAATFYLLAYFITTLGAFGVVSVLSPASRDADSLADYRGLFWKRPALAGVFTAMLLSLAGIPLTAGFLGKFYIVAAGASQAVWTLVIVLVVTSAIGLYYYLRIIVAMYSPEEGEPQPSSPVSFSGGLVLAVLTVLLLWVGIYPAPWLEAIRTAVESLV